MKDNKNGAEKPLLENKDLSYAKTIEKLIGNAISDEENHGLNHAT